MNSLERDKETYQKHQYHSYLHDESSARARAILDGYHDALLSALKEIESLEKKYNGLEEKFVISILKKYRYETKERKEKHCHCIDIIKDNKVCAVMTYDAKRNKVINCFIK